MVPHVIIPLRRRGAVWEAAALVEGLRERDPAAIEAFFDGHVSHVRSVLHNVLGRDDEIPDLLQEVFLRALAGIDSLREPAKLQGWLTSIAVFAARGYIRGKVRRRWLRLSLDEVGPLNAGPVASHDLREACRRTYALLERLSADERVAFSLRHIQGMELTAVAEACQTSLATIKRRLARAQRRFLAMARREPALQPWIGKAHG